MTDDKHGLCVELFQLLDGTADGAFVVGHDRRILYWNQAAERMLGYSSGAVVGRICYEIFSGQDDEGDGICRHHCPLIAASRQENPVSNYDARVRTQSGEWRWVNVSTLVCHTRGDETQLVAVYLFRDNTQHKRNEQFVRQVLDATRRLQPSPSAYAPPPVETPPAASDLTDREFEVLNLLVQGLGTDDIAQALYISPTTARNHIQSILRKLGAHSRLQAVIQALKQGLVTIED